MKSLDQRAMGVGLTAGGGWTFERDWTPIAQTLVRFVRGLGGSRDLADDVTQEVALRLLRTQPVLTERKDLVRWCHVVARNVYIDHVRRVEATSTDPHELPEAIDGVDVARTVEARLMLSKVSQVLFRMSSSDRNALVQLVQDEPLKIPSTRRESTRLAVQRHRARARLQELLAATGVILVFLAGRLRRVAHGASVVAACVLPLLVTLAPDSGSSRGVAAPFVSDQAVVRVQGLSHIALGHEGVPSPRHRSQNAQQGMPTPSSKRVTNDLVVATPVRGVTARTGTRKPTDDHLACAGIGLGLSDVCVDKPIPVSELRVRSQLG